MLAPHVVADWAKSTPYEPTNVVGEIVTGALVLLVRVTFFAVLVVPIA